MAAFNRAEQLTDAFAEKLNAKDPAALGELFVEDAEFINIMGMRMRGRQGIVDGHAWGSTAHCVDAGFASTRSTRWP